MQKIAVIISTLFVLFSFPCVWAKHHHTSLEGAENCYDSSDQRMIRLWESSAPGAVANDPCKDIPYMRIFPAPNVHKGVTPAILIIPGGGYDRLTNLKEQAPVAEYFSKNFNVTAFVLYYRLVQDDGTYRYPVPMWDGQRALKFIRYHAREYGVDPKRVGLFGFSAGGHLASTLALHSASDFNLPTHDGVDAMSGRPTILGLGYPVISMDSAQFAAKNSRAHLLYGYHGRELEHLEKYLSGQNNVTSHTPPVFLFSSMDDQRISPQNSVMFAQALRSANIPIDAHLFEHGAHGAGLAVDIPEEQTWPKLFHEWLLNQHFLQ